MNICPAGRVGLKLPQKWTWVKVAAVQPSAETVSGNRWYCSTNIEEAVLISATFNGGSEAEAQRH
jgi:hypothetical protein